MNYNVTRHKLSNTFQLLICSLLIVYQCDGVAVLRSNLPGPLVYVVTPASRSKTFDNEPPYRRPYYSNSWRRMDEEATTTAKPKQTNETPDLIFAEFEADDGKKGGQLKSIRKLLEREKVKIPMETEIEQSTSAFIINVAPTEPTTTSTTTTTLVPMKVEDIWHIINQEQADEDIGWKQVSIPSQSPTELPKETDINEPVYTTKDITNGTIFYPGLKTNKENEGDNESRAIRTEYGPKIRFPYFDLNTLQSSSKKKGVQGNKNENNLYTNLDSYQNEKYPLKGEAQELNYRFPLIDRYNPAQPYLPPAPSPAKQSFAPTVAPKPAQTENLVPPPPPPPRSSFASPPRTYESFPPFGSSFNQIGPPSASFMPPAERNPPSSSDTKDNVPPDTPDFSGYTYNPPPSYDMGPPSPDKPPKEEPMKPAFGGYNYSPPKEEPAKPDFGGYNYSPPKEEPAKPDFGGYHYSPPVPSFDSKPPSYDKAPPKDEPPSFPHHPGYEKPYGHHHEHSHVVAHEYPELIYDKKPDSGMDMGSMADSMGGMGDSTGGKDAIKDMGLSDSGMPDEGMPPPPPPDHGGPEAKFPDFTFDKPPFDDHHFKYHDFEEDHDFHHHLHHHTTTTTTTTTEMPRVNRFSYYYLGKKLYYLPLYFSVYFTAYVAALIIKSILRHKITYPQHFQNVSKRSLDSFANKLDLSSGQLHEISRVVTNGLIRAGERYTEARK